MRLESSISGNIRNFFGVDFFIFMSSDSSLLKYRKFFRGFYFLKYKKSLRGNIRNFLILRLESSISWNKRNFFGVDFFYFFELGLKSAPRSSIYNYWKYWKYQHLHGYKFWRLVCRTKDKKTKQKQMITKWYSCTLIWAKT